MAEESRILTVEHGRIPQRKRGDFITRGDMETIVAEAIAAHAATVQETTGQKVIEICEFYLNQMPGLVAKMLEAAFAANGMVLNPPPVSDPGHTGETMDGASPPESRAQHADANGVRVDEAHIQ